MICRAVFKDETRLLFRDVLLVVTLGSLAYSPVFRYYYWMDDVDHFVKLAQAVQGGSLIQYFFEFPNGHLTLIPRILYWFNYVYFDRSIFVWHMISLIVYGIASGCGFYLFLYFLRDRVLAVVLAILFATSVLFRHILTSTSALNHLFAYGLTLLSWALTCRYLSERRRSALIVSVIAGAAALVSGAFGLLAFPGQVVLLGLSYLKTRRVNTVAVVVTLGCSVASFALYWFLGLQTGAGSGLDLSYGLEQTLLGLFKRSFPNTLSITNYFTVLPVLLALAAIFVKRGGLDWNPVLFSVFVMVVPLMLATSVRTDFIDPGKWGRYHYLPAMGVLLIIGVGWKAFSETPLFSHVRRKRFAALILLTIFLAANTGVAFYRNYNGFDDSWTNSAGVLMSGESRRELGEVEAVIGIASIEYSKRYDTDTISVPDVQIQLPAFFYPQPLVSVARYATPVRHGFEFETAQPGDTRFFNMLREDPVYAPICRRLFGKGREDIESAAPR